MSGTRGVRITDTPNVVIVEGDGEVVRIVAAGPTGPQGVPGPTGATGVVDATAPITYDLATQTVAIDATGYVASVNTSTGVVVLGASDVGAYPDTNPSAFIDAAGAPVQSVNGGTGVVVLGAADVGAYADTNPSSFVDAAGAAAAAPVQSVDSLTGAVDLVPRYAVAADTAPVSPFVGQRWVQTSTGRLAYWTGTEWVEIGALGLDLSVAAADPAFTGAFTALIPYRLGADSFYPIVSSGLTTTSPAEATEFVMPLYIPRGTIAVIGAEVTTVGTSGAVVRLGIRKQVGALDLALVADVGTISGETLGEQSVTANLAWPGGLAWISVTIQGGAGTRPTLRGVNGSIPFMPYRANQLNSQRTGLAGVGGATTGALPSAFTSQLAQGASPRAFVRMA